MFLQLSDMDSEEREKDPQKDRKSTKTAISTDGNCDASSLGNPFNCVTKHKNIYIYNIYLTLHTRALTSTLV